MIPTPINTLKTEKKDKKENIKVGMTPFGSIYTYKESDGDPLSKETYSFKKETKND